MSKETNKPTPVDDFIKNLLCRKTQTLRILPALLMTLFRFGTTWLRKNWGKSFLTSKRWPNPFRKKNSFPKNKIRGKITFIRPIRLSLLSRPRGTLTTTRREPNQKRKGEKVAKKILVNGYPAICLTNRNEAVFCQQQGFSYAQIGALITFANEEKRQRFLSRMYKVTRKPAPGRKRRRTPPHLDNGLPIVL